MAAQTRIELLLTLRRSESLLVTLAIPLGILVFFSKVDAVTDLSDPVDFLVPGVLALAVMSTAMVSLGIATGYERRYGVLKRIGSTPLSRGGLLTAKTANVLLIELAQAAIIVVVGIALGWSTSARILPAVVLLLVGTVAFAGIGLLMAGTLRAETNLALSNAAARLGHRDADRRRVPVPVGGVEPSARRTAEQLREGARERGLAREAEDAGRNRAVGADEEALRDRAHAERARNRAAVVDALGPRGLFLFHERARVGGDVLVGHPDHGEVLRAVVAERLLEEGELLAARVAPRRPEVHDHGPAAIVGEALVAVPVEGRELEVRCGGADLGARAADGAGTHRAAAVRTAAEHGDQHTGHEPYGEDAGEDEEPAAPPPRPRPVSGLGRACRRQWPRRAARGRRSRRRTVAWRACEWRRA